MSAQLDQLTAKAANDPDSLETTEGLAALDDGVQALAEGRAVLAVEKASEVHGKISGDGDPRAIRPAVLRGGSVQRGEADQERAAADDDGSSQEFADDLRGPDQAGGTCGL